MLFGSLKAFLFASKNKSHYSCFQDQEAITIQALSIYEMPRLTGFNMNMHWPASLQRTQRWRCAWKNRLMLRYNLQLHLSLSCLDFSHLLSVLVNQCSCWRRACGGNNCIMYITIVHYLIIGDVDWGRLPECDGCCCKWPPMLSREMCHKVYSFFVCVFFLGKFNSMLQTEAVFLQKQFGRLPCCSGTQKCRTEIKE